MSVDVSYGLVRSVLFLSLACVPACADPTDARATLCAQVNDDVSKCLGKGAPLFDCALATTPDLEAAETLATGPACELAGEAPIDGDANSAACRLYGFDCVRSIQSQPPNDPTRYPLVLVNGIDTSPIFRYSARIQSVLEAQGNHVYLGTLTPYQSPEKRAPLLSSRIDEILAESGATKVNLICHSLGGLDCRYYASPNGLAADLGLTSDALSSKVASITTIGTPHRGTRAADSALGLLPGDPAQATIDALASVFGAWFSADALTNNPDIRAALQALTVSNMQAWNASVNDAPDLYYQSYAGFSRPDGTSTPAHDAAVSAECKPSSPADGNGLSLVQAEDYLALPLVPLYPIVGNGETDIDAVEPNDGLVTITSAIWGRFRGCVPADHVEQLGEYNLPDVNVRTGVDIAWFYGFVASDLAGKGF